MTIWFDMDGTFVDLYGVDGWLDDLKNSNPRPYIEAKPLFNLSTFARLLHRVQIKGYEIGIVSWLSKNGTDDFNEKVTAAKVQWLKTHLPSVTWDKVAILPYGTYKEVGRSGILFDDEEPNRHYWNGISYTPELIFKVLGHLEQWPILPGRAFNY